jgi:hypothetical protein
MPILLNLRDSIVEQGYALISGVFDRGAIDRLLQELSGVNLPRSRAGVRHAMRIPAVAEMARGADLLGIAREILGEDAFPFARHCLTSPRPRIGWSFGTRTRRCR